MSEAAASYDYAIRMGGVDLYQGASLRCTVPWPQANRLVVILDQINEILSRNPGPETAREFNENLAYQIAEHSKRGVSFQEEPAGYRILYRGKPAGWMEPDTDGYETDPGSTGPTPWLLSITTPLLGNIEVGRFPDQLAAGDAAIRCLRKLAREAMYHA